MKIAIFRPRLNGPLGLYRFKECTVRPDDGPCGTCANKPARGWGLSLPAIIGVSFGSNQTSAEAYKGRKCTP